MVATNFLRIALGKKRGEIVRILQDDQFTKAEFVELEVAGVPGVERVVFFAWPDPLTEPSRIGVDVVQLDDEVLDDAVRLGFELDDPSTTVTAEEALAVWPGESSPIKKSSGWHRVEGGQIRREVTTLTASGRPVFREVDTDIHCFRLVCPNCGRERYARPNSIHQIDRCHVCTRQNRLRRRSLAQYKQRFANGGRKRMKARRLKK